MDQIVTAGYDGSGVGVTQVSPPKPSVPFQGAGRGHQDCRAGQQSALTGLDVHEFFEAQVRCEPGFGDDVVGIAQCHLVGDDGAAAVGDVAEGTGMDD